MAATVESSCRAMPVAARFPMALRIARFPFAGSVEAVVWQAQPDCVFRLG